MKTVYNKNTGLGGKVIHEVGCDYFNVAWFDGTFTVVNISQIESKWYNKLYYYFPNLQLRVERWVENNMGDVIVFILAMVSFLAICLITYLL